MNTVTLIGRWTKDLEIRVTGTGKSVAKGRLAVGSGEKALYLDVVIWDTQAENTVNHCGLKGNQVGISGHLQTRQFDGKDGQKRTVTEVVADRVDFLNKNDGERSAPKAAPGMGSEQNYADTDDVPF